MRPSPGPLLWLLGCAPALRAPSPPGPPARLALAVPGPRRLVEVDGVPLAIHDSDPSGARPAVLCLHAIAHGGGDFEGVITALSDRYRIIAVDWPGHGASGVDRHQVSAVRYAALAAGLLDQLGLGRVVILGNSIGGAAAMRLAAERPGQVRGLILANPGGLDPGGLIASVFIGGLVSRFRSGVRDEASFGAWFREYYQGILVTEAARARRELITAAGHEHAALLVQAWESFRSADASVIHLIPRLTMPVLFTWARRDRLVSWDRNRAAVHRFPLATTVFFPAGHSPFLETPEDFIAAVEPFLAALPR